MREEGGGLGAGGPRGVRSPRERRVVMGTRGDSPPPPPLGDRGGQREGGRRSGGPQAEVCVCGPEGVCFTANKDCVGKQNREKQVEGEKVVKESE